MTSMTGVRKAALVTSLLDRGQRRRLLASLPANAAGALAQALREVERYGWGRRDIVERALGEDLSGPVNEKIGLRQLMALSTLLDSAEFARVLVATQADPEFVISMLESPLAERVRMDLRNLPTMPDRLRAAVHAGASALLHESQVEVAA